MSLTSLIYYRVSVSIPKRRSFKGPQQQQRTDNGVIGFVGFGNEADVEKAVEKLNGTQLAGQTIEVAKAKPLTDRKPREPRPPKVCSASLAP